MLTLPSEFASTILAFAPLFFNRTWRYAQTLLVGALLAPGKRTVTSVLRVMGLSAERHFQNYHRVLNRAVWSCHHASLILLRLLLATFAPRGPLVLGLDDTIERRWGAKIRARGIYRDPVRSSDSHFVKTSGLRWLSLMLLAPIPWVGHVWALPFLTVLAPSQRYWQQRGLPRQPKSLTDWARQMLLQVQRWLPTRSLVLVADGAFAALGLLVRLTQGPRPITCVTRLRLDARLHRPAPARQPGRKGRPRVVGTRLPSLQQVLTNSRTCWQRLTLRHWYSQGHRRVEITSGTAVWYHGGLPPLLLRWVLVRDPKGKPVPPPDPAMVSHALASGSDLPRGASPSRVETQRQCPTSRCSHHPRVARAVLPPDSAGYPPRWPRKTPGAPSRLVLQTLTHLLRRHRVGAPTLVAPHHFFYLSCV